MPKKMHTQSPERLSHLSHPSHLSHLSDSTACCGVQGAMDNINLFSVITLLSFLLLLPVTLLSEGAKFTPGALEAMVGRTPTAITIITIITIIILVQFRASDRGRGWGIGFWVVRV